MGLEVVQKSLVRLYLQGCRGCCIIGVQSVWYIESVTFMVRSCSSIAMVQVHTSIATVMHNFKHKMFKIRGQREARMLYVHVHSSLLC